MKKIYTSLKDFYNQAPISIRSNLKTNDIIICYKKDITYNELVKVLQDKDTFNKYKDKKIKAIVEKQDI